MSDWDFYEGRIDDDRAFVSIDLALVREAPIASHPTRLEVRIPMRIPRADGLRSSEEADALFALEDRIQDTLVSTVGARDAARIVAQGYTTLVYYVASATDDPFARLGDVRPYALEWSFEDDPRWARYESLYPNRRTMLTIQNRRLVTHMEDVGDRISVPREIDHFAYFPSESHAREASSALAARGFQVDDAESRDGLWALGFHRVDACDGSRPDEFVFEILDLLEPFEADYDGWGCGIVEGSGSRVESKEES